MSELERRVSETVEAARVRRRLRPEALCAVAGFSRASYYVRMTSGGWRLAELERVAELLDVPLTSLLSGGSSSAWAANRRSEPVFRVLAA